MPSGTPRVTPWVQVPELKGPGMCGQCGRRGVRFLTVEQSNGLHNKARSWCCEVDAFCQKAAMRCAGPFIQEHKIAKMVRMYVDQEEEQ